VEKRQWFQPVVDCGVFCVQPQNFWVNYVWLCTIMYVYIYMNDFFMGLSSTIHFLRWFMLVS
jgi:hypothetical protein